MTVKSSSTCAALVVVACLTGCARQGDAVQGNKAELTTLDVTHWTEKTELFMEYPPLVAGGAALFAVHLTRLGDFKALDAGRPRLEFMPSSGGTLTSISGPPAPSRPGVFRVQGALPAAGQYRWALILDAPGLSDRHDLGTVSVFPDLAAALAGAETQPANNAATVSYLKEQQWTNDFATALVGESELRTTLRVPAAIEPLTGGEAIVTAPAHGRFAADSLLPVGSRVGAGQALGRLEPRLAEGGEDRATIVADLAEARATAEGAHAELARAERLLAERAVPARRVEDARRAVNVSEARLHAAEARLEQRDETLRSGGGVAAGNAFVLRAPIAGRLTEVYAALGASYDEDTPLFRIVRTDRVELQAQVPAADAFLSRTVVKIELEIPGRAEPIALEPEHMHDAGVIDAKTRALQVQFDVSNSDGKLLVGQTGTAVLFTGTVQSMTVVPSAAVLMEAGRPYVFVHTSGESFARRFIEIGAHEGDRVGVKSGVKPGERVVTRGAYEVQLASAAKGLPAEGHVH